MRAGITRGAWSLGAFAVVAALTLSSSVHALASPLALGTEVLALTGPSFVVNSVEDGPDLTTNGVCADAKRQCTLRAAIQEANDGPDKNAILFEEKFSGTIELLSPLPPIIHPVALEGARNALGAPLVELSGARLASVPGVTGLRLFASDSLIRGLTVNGFTHYGIAIEGGTGNRVEACFVGTDARGLVASPNGIAGSDRGGGIGILRSANNVIGGSTPESGNLISGNATEGIVIIGAESTGNKVQGNKIGTDWSGHGPIGNVQTGVLVTGFTGQSDSAASDNIIGGASPFERNVVSGNGQTGIEIVGGARNQVLGNWVGLESSGLSLGNGWDGVRVIDAPDTRVGAAAVGNVISGNTQAGIRIAGAAGTTVQGNLVGTDETGMFERGNGFMGIFINASVNLGPAMSVAIGGTGAGERNIVSGNQIGIGIENGATARVIGNYVGTTKDGLSPLKNNGPGIRISSSSNFIGGEGEKDRNVISGNDGPGVLLFGGATETVISGNWIGVNANLEPLGNTGAGVEIEASSRNVVGFAREMPAPVRKCEGACNRIEANGGSGVLVRGDSATGNTIRANRIVGNMGLGIDLDGGRLRPDGSRVTPNDVPGDQDRGPNGLMNFPAGVAAAYHRKVDKTVVSGWLDHPQAHTATVDVYALRAGDDSGFGESELYLGKVKRVAEDGAFRLVLTGRLPPGFPFVTATATAADGSTSEFSAVCGDPDGDGSPDTDGDSLCDDWEVPRNGGPPGLDYDGDGSADLSFPEGSPTRKDVYLELDTMAISTGQVRHDHKLHQDALERIRTAFADAPVPMLGEKPGIGFHVDLEASDVIEEVPLLQFSLSRPGSGHKTDFNDLKLGVARTPCGVSEGSAGAPHFGSATERKSSNCANILGARRLVFRYGISGHRQTSQSEASPQGLNGRSGSAEFHGNDMLITLHEGFVDEALMLAQALRTSPSAELADMQGGTLMHEVGHLLGLHHGGDSNRPGCKPNHFSVMNYSYQFDQRGLPRNLPSEPVRPGQVVRVHRPLQYSSGKARTLDENALKEADGVDAPSGWRVLYGIRGERQIGPGTGAIDWNGNGSVGDFLDGGALSDVNHLTALTGCGPELGEVLTDHDDWNNLEFDFRGGVRFSDLSPRSEVQGGDPDSEGDPEDPAPEEERELDDLDLRVGLFGKDFDGDGVATLADGSTLQADNCPSLANPTQADSDRDGIGDACSVAELQLGTDRVLAGGAVNATVTLVTPAPPGGAFLHLMSDDPAAAQVPPSLLVPEGGTTAAFQVTTAKIAHPVTVAISAYFGHHRRFQQLLVDVAPPLKGLLLEPATVWDGRDAAGTVLLGEPAHQGGAVVALSSDNPAAALVQATVSVPEGERRASFAVDAADVTSSTFVTISASLGDVTLAEDLTVLAEAPRPGRASINSGCTVAAEGGTPSSESGPVQHSSPSLTGGADSASQRLHAQANTSHFGLEGGEDCGITSEFRNTVVIRPGTTGLPEGAPVQLRVSAGFLGFTSVKVADESLEFTSQASVQARYRISRRSTSLAGGGEEAQAAPLIFSGQVQQRLVGQRSGTPKPEESSSGSWEWSLRTNRGLSLNGRDASDCGRACTGAEFGVDVPPQRATFDARVGDRLILEGNVHALGTAFADLGTVSATGFGGFGLIIPAPGFEGLDIAVNPP